MSLVHPRRQQRAESMLAEARTHLAHNRVAEAARTLERAIQALDDRGAGVKNAVEVLTPAEVRVARMAAAGMKNREIAAELTVTINAVEYHLANTYRKLGVRGRTELTRMFNWAGPVLMAVAAG
jgi:DNA-binding NarL/FixJ family response regulator